MFWLADKVQIRFTITHTSGTLGCQDRHDSRILVWGDGLRGLGHAFANPPNPKSQNQTIGPLPKVRLPFFSLLGRSPGLRGGFGRLGIKRADDPGREKLEYVWGGGKFLQL